MERLRPPRLKFVFDMELTVDQPHFPGNTPAGTRRIIRVTGGKFKGKELQGEVVPGGDDWITVLEDGTIIQDVRILLKTDDGEYILMTYRGVRTGPKDVLERLDRNEAVDLEEYYFSTAPVFETASKKYNWLNKRIFISKGKRLPGKVNYSIYVAE